MAKPLLAITEVRQILSKSLRFRSWRLATRTFSSPPQIFYGIRSGDWLGHSRTLICFFLSHSFVSLAMCFGSLSCWNTHPRHIFKAWRYMALSIVPLRWCSCPCLLSRKHPQSIMFPPPCLMVGWCSWGHRQHSSSSSKHGKLSWCQRAWFWSHLTTTLSPSSPLNHWQTSGRACTCAFLSRGTLRAL